MPGHADRRRATDVGARVARLTGGILRYARPVGGGSICDAWHIRLDEATAQDAAGQDCAGQDAVGQDGSPRFDVFAKTLPGAPPDFFTAEAAGLRMLRDTRTVPVPGVTAAEDGLLVLRWIEPGPPTPEQAERLGRELAALHAIPAPSYGTPDRPAYLGPLPLSSPGPGHPVTAPEDWPAFHAEHRLLPFLRLAVDNGALEPADQRSVERLSDGLGAVAGPPQAPAVIHGDLWSGNVHWSADGRAHLIDPAAQGGHPETDLALLELFGCPQLTRVLAAYEEVRPLPGRAARVPLHQLQHLLVHAALFGSGYGARCGEAARAALAA